MLSVTPTFPFRHLLVPWRYPQTVQHPVQCALLLPVSPGKADHSLLSITVQRIGLYYYNTATSAYMCISPHLLSVSKGKDHPLPYPISCNCLFTQALSSTVLPIRGVGPRGDRPFFLPIIKNRSCTSHQEEVIPDSDTEGQSHREERNDKAASFISQNNSTGTEGKEVLISYGIDLLYLFSRGITSNHHRQTLNISKHQRWGMR